MKVYIVEKGAYSDRHVVAVCKTKDLAKKLVAAHSDDWDKAYYTEFDTDSYESDVYRILYCIDFYDYGHGHPVPSCRVLRQYEAEYTEDGEHDEYEWKVYAEDKEHAIKKACDMRAQYLAERSGIT